MKQLFSIINSNMVSIVLIVVLATIVNLIWTVVNGWQGYKMRKNYNKLMEGMNRKNLEEMLTGHINKVDNVFYKSLEIEKAYKELRIIGENSIQNVGVIRFNAFNDTGSDLSFAVALLDHQGDGVVLTGLFGRNETRTYAKPVKRGTSSYNLSEEEEEAIRKAYVR
jgi:hypothetical protein